MLKTALNTVLSEQESAEMLKQMVTVQPARAYKKIHCTRSLTAIIALQSRKAIQSTRASLTSAAAAKQINIVQREAVAQKAD